VVDAHAPRKSVIPTYGTAFAGTLIAALISAASRIAPSRVTAHLGVTILYPPYLKLSETI
jgi:hypothetical protein